MERYFLEPYRFIAPFRSTFWCRLGVGVVARSLRRKHGVLKWHVGGLEHLRQSLQQDAGILLAPNHCRWADPMVLGMVARQCKRFFYYIASYHLFRQNRFMGLILNRLGGYSIWREGADRESIKATTRILGEAERPVVIFPEGTWFRQNDRVGPLQDGLSLITRQTARQSTRPIVIHPVGIKYWHLEDPAEEIDRRLEKLERQLSWSPQRDLPIVPRIEKLGGALLAIKEIEFLGQPQAGDLDERIKRLSISQIERVERQHLGKSFEGWPLERIRRLRQHLSRQLLEKKSDTALALRIKKDLHDLLFCENLSAQSLEYLRESPTSERIAETIQRIEETATDKLETPLGKMGVAIEIGAPLDVRNFQAREGADRRGVDPMVQRLRTDIQGLIDQMLRQGPPAEWNCAGHPSRVSSVLEPSAGPALQEVTTAIAAATTDRL